LRKKIGECLIQAGLITEDDLRIALAEHKRTGERVGVVLVRMNLATEKQIAKALAFQLGFPYVNLGENPPDPTAVVLIPKEVALKRVCVAVSLEKNLLTVAMSDPLLFSLVQDLEFQTGYRIKQVVATRDDINDAIQTCYPDKALMRTTPGSRTELAVSVPAGARPRRGGPDVEVSTGETALARRVEEEVFEPVAGLKERSEAAPIIDLVDLVVKSAIKSKASDVHVEPMEKGVLIRHRLDGLLKEVMDLPKWVHEGLIARLKIMAGMDIAEKRLPQDGRLRSSAEDGTEVDFRVSTLRTLFGEKIVMRVLDHRKGVPALEEIGMSAAALEEVREFLRHQHGMILVVGPTGSGKTTTLSSALKAVQSEKTNIITIEDPIEYQLSGVGQMQVNPKIDLTFANGLRSILRQDPDVIMVGEIRDVETAEIAIHAALTGHLVFSTLHTNDSFGAVTRLVDMGIEPFLVSSSVIAVMAQRLVRRVCPTCRVSSAPTAEQLAEIGLTPERIGDATIYASGDGCGQCKQTGYRGRAGIHELLIVGDEVRGLIMKNADAATIRREATIHGMPTLRADGAQKVLEGLTTIEEVMRVTQEDLVVE
jgi:type II secretory ATPase GspE/PulE/Tfp pilus assembly ATPase PilB-like protein